MSPIVVLDTNVVFSAIGWGGTPRRCLELAQAGTCEAVSSIELMEELAGTLRKKLGFSETQILETYQRLMGFLRLAAVEEQMTGVCSDPKDDKVLACGVAARANYIVTGDRKHLLPLREFRGIRIISPAVMLSLVETGG